MGPDGHTSGIMPYPENPDYFYKTFDNTDQWIVAYDANAKNQYPQRVTTTFPFLRMIDYSIFFVTGENKKNAFQRVLSNSAPLHETPATIIQSMKNVFVFTDITV
jgi:6-phosphogluconolactonase/glucosamine-6-phosphate isomerase/deaminase